VRPDNHRLVLVTESESLQDLCGFLSELPSLDIDLFLHQQGIDTMTPAGKAMFQMMGVFAEFQRSMIRERVNALRPKASTAVAPSSILSWMSASGRLWLLLGAQEFTSLQSSLASAAGRSSALPGLNRRFR
jgi:hypothetical protein